MPPLVFTLHRFLIALKAIASVVCGKSDLGTVTSETHSPEALPQGGFEHNSAGDRPWDPQDELRVHPRAEIECVA